MLEQYFLKPETVDQIRSSWLGEPIERYVKWSVSVLDEAELAGRKAPDMTGSAAADFSCIRNASLARITLDRPMKSCAARDGRIRVTVHVDPRWSGAAATQFPG